MTAIDVGAARSRVGSAVAVVVALVVIGAFVLGAASGALGDVWPNLPFLVVLAVTIGVGWLVAFRRPRNALGWMLLGVPGLFGIGIPLTVIAQALLERAPTAAAWLLLIGGEREDTWAWIPPVTLLLIQIPLFVPTGRLPSPRWRWFWAWTLVATALTCVLFAGASSEVAPGIANPMPALLPAEEGAYVALLVVCLGSSAVGAAVSLFMRYRRAGEVERAQLRWVLWGVSIPVSLLVFSWIFLTGIDVPALDQLVLLTYGFVPVSIGIAVLRYRLFEIDRILSRTAAYALVTVVAALTYAAVVISVTALLPGAPSIAVAVATLAAAAVFLPVLRRLRHVIDRRFDRAQYRAEQVVEAFGKRLRDGEDPHSTAAELTDAAAATLQPAAIGLWVAPPENLRRTPDP